MDSKEKLFDFMKALVNNAEKIEFSENEYCIYVRDTVDLPTTIIENLYFFTRTRYFGYKSIFNDQIKIDFEFDEESNKIT